MMRVTAIEKYLIHQRMRPGTVNGPEYQEAAWDEIPKWIIRVMTDASMVGVGETYRGTTEEEVDRCGTALLGLDPLRLNLRQLPMPPGPAYAAFEMALFDVVGKARGLRVCDLLGGAFRDRVEVDWWSGRRNPEDLAKVARDGWDRGFRGIKIKCTLEDPMVERVQACWNAVPDMQMTIDPNTRFYRPADAIRLGRQLERFSNVARFEDPTPKSNLDWYRLMREKLDIPIALHLSSPHDLLAAIKAECIDHVNLSPSSMVQFVWMAELAGVAGIPCWHGSGNDCGIMDLSYVHACAAAPNCTLPSDIAGNFLHEEDFLVEPIKFEGGCAIVPAAPGLGAELDLQAVEAQLIRKVVRGGSSGE